MSLVKFLSKFIPEIQSMSQQAQDLAAAVATLKTQVTAIKSVADTLKSKLDAAIADNVAKAGQITDLQAQLAAAQAAAGDQTDPPVIKQATTDVTAASQTLADTAAQDAASN